MFPSFLPVDDPFWQSRSLPIERVYVVVGSGADGARAVSVAAKRDDGFLSSLPVLPTRTEHVHCGLTGGTYISGQVVL